MSGHKKTKTAEGSMPRAHGVQPSVDTRALAGLPRRRPEAASPLVSRHAIQAIDDLRRLRPPIHLLLGTEAAFLRETQLTRGGCLHWLRVAKQFYIPPTGQGIPMLSRNTPPISFLNLLIDWIEGDARIKKRRNIKKQDWRWRALHGFANRDRRLKTDKFLDSISLLVRAIAVQFSKPPSDHLSSVLWGDCLRYYNLQDTRGDGTECGQRPATVFQVLRRFVVHGKVATDDYATLKPYVSKEFHEPFFIKELHDGRERRSLEAFRARAAVMDVYLQYQKIMHGITSDRDYIEDVTKWLLKLGDIEARPQFEAIYWRFFGRPAG